jgi:hypothetical protein
MTTDSTLPEEPRISPPPADLVNANKDGREQKPSFRRRRRRRGSGGNPGQPGLSSQPGAQPSNGQPTNGAAPESGRHDKSGRKGKKRFFRKNRGQNPGQNGGQGHMQSRQPAGGPRGNRQQPPRRGKKQRRPKVFVGPMDHSYRTSNGNYDAPPSTIDLQRGFRNMQYNGNGNGNGNFNVDPDASGFPRIPQEPEASARPSTLENAPARIYCFIEDLFFVAKIQETARKLGIKIVFAKNDKDTVANLLDAPEEERPALMVFDLNNANAKPLTLIPKLKGKLKRSTSIVGFLSHLQGELKAKAIEAGCDTVMPRSAFSQNLPTLLRRYGMEAEPEIEDSQIHVIEG